MAISKAGRVRNTVGIVVDGKNRGIVSKAKFLEDIQSPERLAGDRITRGAITKNRFADDVFED